MNLITSYNSLSNSYTDFSEYQNASLAFTDTNIILNPQCERLNIIRDIIRYPDIDDIEYINNLIIGILSHN